MSTSEMFLRHEEGSDFMPDLFYARSQIAMSLAFHIVFAVLGIGMPVLMAIAE